MTPEFWITHVCETCFTHDCPSLRWHREESASALHTMTEAKNKGGSNNNPPVRCLDFNCVVSPDQCLLVPAQSQLC